MALVCHPLTPDRWPDLERLFGPERGGVAGCWCLWFRLTRREWDAAGRDGRKRAFRMLVEAYPTNQPPGTRATGFRGLLRPFLDSRFVEVARRSPIRPILRLELAG